MMARIPIWLTALALLLASLWAAPGAAHVPDKQSFAPTCHAYSGADRSMSAMSGRSAWDCSGTGWRSDHPVAWLRFDMDQVHGKDLPRYFFSRITRFNSITFAALDADGSLRVKRFTEADARPFPAGPVFRLTLPEVRSDTRALLVRIERPHSVPLLTEARLTRVSNHADWNQFDMLLLALVIGMLVLPLLFDISFFVVLRERFVAIHAAMVAAMIVYVAFAGGLISAFVTLPVPFLAVVPPLSFAIGGGMSGLLLVNFLERGAQSDLMRRITFWSACFTIVVPGFFALQFDATQPIDDRAYFLTYLPFIFVLTAAVAEAVWRGSRSARFIAVAWTPIILASFERLSRGLGWHVGPSRLDQLQYIAIGIEVVVISLAIADRFLALRRERDEALSEARVLEKLSTRDSLTGLMNRRAIEARFNELLAQGFDTFALVDLDRFKAINDLHGHQVGDAALIACGAAIRGSGERDLVAVRLGGEEFVVLLRGERTLERAEALRQAVPLRIAADVPGLDLPVTASMGVVVLPDAARHNIGFAEFYARADALMYEAKAAGRNRMAYERLTVFGEPRATRKAECGEERAA